MTFTAQPAIERASSFLKPAQHQYHFVRVSGNSKTGPIPVTTSSYSTCPDICPLKDKCYGHYGRIKLHWDEVSYGDRGITLEEMCAQISLLPKLQLWRCWQVGDMPGDGVNLDRDGVRKIVRANKGRLGFAFCHYDVIDNAHNRQIILEANLAGFTINLSANNLEHADQLAALDIGPVVTILPADASKPLRTPKGRLVAICPATQHEHIQCANCGICQTHRKAIIGFPAHSSGKKHAERVFFMRQEQFR